jgi:hypothetical protein
LAVLPDKGRIQLLAVGAQTGMATITKLPVTGSVEEVGVDAMVPLANYSVSKDKANLPLLLPYLRWHLDAMSEGGDGHGGEERDGVARSASQDHGAFIRMRSVSDDGADDEADNDAGGGWNRPRQACLALRALHSMLVRCPSLPSSQGKHAWCMLVRSAFSNRILH